MHADCIAEIAAAIGRAPTKRELDAFEGDLLRQMRELARSEPTWATLTGQQRLQLAGERAQADALAAADKQAQRRASNLTAQAREVARMQQRAGEIGGAKAAHRAVFERMRQADDYIAGVRNETLSNLVDAIHAVEPRFFGLMDNPDAVRGFARAVMDGNAATPELAKAAKAYTEAMESVRLRANAAGADIGKLDYGYLPQPHDVGRVARAGAEAWSEAVLPRLDRSRYVGLDGAPMGDAEVLAMLRGAWDTIATEGRNQRVPGQSGGGSRASRFDDAHRAIHFKDADAYLDYLGEYGRGSMMQAIHGHVGMMAKSIGLMEEFGANPNSTYRLMKDSAEQLDNLQGASESFATLDMVWDTLNGTTAQPVSAQLAQFWQGVRNFTTAAKLQGVMLSAITDAPLQVIVAKANGVPLGQALKSLVAGVGGDTRAAAHQMAIGMDEIAGEMSRWHQDHLAQGWTAKLANTTMKLTLVEAWTNALRRGFALTMSGTLNTMRRTNWADLAEGDRIRFKSSGVTEADWAIWQLADDYGTGQLTRQGIRAIPDSKIDTVLAGDLNRIKVDAQAQIDKLDTRNQQEQAWLTKRRTEYAQAQKDAAAEVDRLRATKDAKASEAADQIEIQAQIIAARLELAQVAHASGDTSARAFGRQEGATEQRLQQLEARARSTFREAGMSVDKAAEVMGRKLSAQRRELEEFAQRSSERVTRRQAVMAKLDKSVAPTSAAARTAAINRATARLIGYLDQEARTAVLAPDVMTRAMVQQGTRAGTWGGEALRSAMLFKSFAFGIVDKHLRRMRNIPSNQGRAAYSVAMLTSLTLFGAVATQLKDMAQGKDPRDMTTPKFWTAAFLQGGGLGIVGDLAYTGMGGNARGGQANWTSLAGPVFGTAFDFADLTIGNLYRAAAGKKTDAGADALRFVRGNTPFVNLWYLRGAVDHMVLHDLQEQASPGYLRRMRKRARKDWDQDFWWTPGEAIPDRAPDFSAAAGDH